QRSLSAADARRRFGFAEASTDAGEVLDDPSLDAVFVVTRHSSHAALVCRALEAGKAVFVEKPLCLDERQLEAVLATIRRSGNDRLVVGFNRRFAPLLTEMRARFGDPAGPVLARYHVNAGALAATSWYRREDLEGSRFVGEGGHFVDTVSWWVGADPVEVTATPAGGDGDLQLDLRYPDGSLGVVTYLTHGHPRAPKETFDVTGGRRSARLDNFARTTVWTGRRRLVRRALGAPDKGQQAELEAFLRAVRTGGPMPIPLASLVATTSATFAAGTPTRPGAAPAS
ncbi:MAG TPA: Gfo/Idh/MocA family oxidoreductase, partial [Acidimicrobiales bacterium]|nr:Gfo/Idh/MocA family oxidoreductase [Acidimicrobiales bacterium]